uniref:Uncharacterized protein n=1 Tax=Psilocybe cubensis TaxID=181762 RepID=A0A8H8CJM4_PSICU
MDGSTSSSVSSDRTITAGRIQGASGSRGTDGGESWGGFGHGRDAGDTINDVEAAASTTKTPPPAYATLSASTGTSTGFAYEPPTHAEFGPTPLTREHALLGVPYHAYEYIGSPGAPDRRARWRFVGGLAWAVVVLWGMGVLSWLALVGEGGQ